MTKNSLLRVLICNTRPEDTIGDNVRAADELIRAEIARYQEAYIIDTATASKLFENWEGYKYAVGANGHPWRDQYNYATAVIRQLG